MIRKIYLYVNNNAESRETADELEALLSREGFGYCEEYEEDSDLGIVVGGDGAFLRALKATGFASMPMLGVNTGHLGFFQEFSRTDLDAAAALIRSEGFTLQSHRLIEADLEYEEQGELKHFTASPALNDVLIRNDSGRMVYLSISIGKRFIEKFYGDGILVASSAGSTAYNYALGGSIVDPNLDLLQIAPMAPANNSTYRSFTSSLLLPPEQEIAVTPEGRDISVIVDGEDSGCRNIRKLTIRLSEKKVNIVRLEDYDFWAKVVSKFL